MEFGGPEEAEGDKGSFLSCVQEQVYGSKHTLSAF